MQDLVDLVARDLALQERLLATSGRDEFIALVVAVAAEHGIVVTAADVDAELVARRRAHLERWI